MENKLINVNEAAKKSNCSRDTIIKYLKEGVIKGATCIVSRPSYLIEEDSLGALLIYFKQKKGSGLRPKGIMEDIKHLNRAK